MNVAAFINMTIYRLREGINGTPGGRGGCFPVKVFAFVSFFFFMHRFMTRCIDLVKTANITRRLKRERKRLTAFECVYFPQFLHTC